MDFFDSSAILPWLRHEERTNIIKPLIQANREIFVWWGTSIECESAIARLERHSELHAGHVASARGRLRLLANSWYEVQPGLVLKTHAHRILRTHSLRAADALQLAAALTLAKGFPSDIQFISFDERLNLAADKEGLQVFKAI